EVCAVGAGGRAEESVVVGVLEVELVGLVVAVLGGEFGLDFVQAERLELEPNERPSRVLREDLIDLDADLFAGFEVALDEVIGEDLLRQCFSHSTWYWATHRYKSRAFRTKDRHTL